LLEYQNFLQRHYF